MSMLYGGTRARRRPIAPCDVRMRRSATSDLSSTRPRRPRLPGGRGRGARQTSGVRAGRGGRTSPAAAPGTAHQTFDARALRQGTSPGHFARGHLLRFRSHVGASAPLPKFSALAPHFKLRTPARAPLGTFYARVPHFRLFSGRGPTPSFCSSLGTPLALRRHLDFRGPNFATGTNPTSQVCPARAPLPKFVRPEPHLRTSGSGGWASYRRAMGVWANLNSVHTSLARTRARRVVVSHQ
jgi:hypothetical protein